ncbi:Protein yhjJ [Gossypium arboreum]|uniref:Protein yhjJ n=1 Tax=Gossypium arboreum TaxID=29729 RepID=A0A0B0MIQ8_GOSAR|nr:Protein yhjJ [Gossypium arboreum]
MLCNSRNATFKTYRGHMTVSYGRVSHTAETRAHVLGRVAARVLHTWPIDTPVFLGRVKLVGYTALI